MVSGFYLGCTNICALTYKKHLVTKLAMSKETSQTQSSDGRAPPELAQEAVMVKSVPVGKGVPEVKGYDFNHGRDLDGIMAAAMTTGFQVCADLGGCRHMFVSSWQFNFDTSICMYI